jgi:hypothetical protein
VASDTTAFLPASKGPLYQLIEIWVSPRPGLPVSEKTNLMLARFETGSVQSNLVAVLTALSRLAQHVKEEFKMPRRKYFDSNNGAVDKNYPWRIMFTVSNL